MRDELTNPNHCAVPFSSRAGAKLCWYYYATKYLVCYNFKFRCKSEKVRVVCSVAFLPSLFVFQDIILLNSCILGFSSALRAATGGQAFPQCVFDHWKVCISILAKYR